jgi:RTX calcium-binding nonapeptide repeat (4 copies)
VGDLLPIVKDISKFNGKEIMLGSFNLDGEQDQLMNDPANFAALTDPSNLAANLTALAPKAVGQLPDMLSQLDPSLDKQIIQVVNDLKNLINHPHGRRRRRPTRAAPNSDDTLTGGSGNDVFYAGGGHDTMTGGTVSNVFNWSEGDGPLGVLGGPSGFNTLSAVGTTVGDQFAAGQDKNGDGGVLVQAPGATIHAFQIQTLSLDEVAGSSRYVLNDLSQTPVKHVGLNLHEESATDKGADEVFVNAPPFNDNVEISWDDQVLAPQGKQVTQIYVSTQPTGRAAADSYQISTSISKTSDVLHVNTFGGDDTVQVDSTQPDLSGGRPGGAVDVNTGAGDDTITAGSPNTGLDDFFGRLNVDAGSGHNRITFDESTSLVHDAVTLTATQVIRSKQTAPMVIPPSRGGGVEIGRPFIINYQAKGGDFAPVNGDPGVVFKTAHGSTDLYVPETGTASPSRSTRKAPPTS